ncbi:carboxylesterase/lipase family protein [[Clostridium] polysaccharolyticum]|uniref:Carboxylic ester hydrolase n=1 Tax=[Clostridium] polysaccharolyticum TaxID=29364 RepID=A0A1I0DVS1_9FIRM|nr:carboxylesterase family protein [[Clostridium] polysaccharolyticum]SET36729.1 para-nitrobenzyl esterase [[Clostridium] polysaccharolyticum]
MNNCKVQTKNGTVEGKLEDGVYQWLGIPYAKKPLGEYRFRRAQPADNWEGILETVKWSMKPLQPPFLTSNPDVEESEDCLYLNIWSSGTGEKKPVVVFIYGSAYIIGEASMKTYVGTRYAQDGIVLVTFNHRVGVFGGYDLAHYPEGERDYDSDIMISDQIQALRWIHENIEAFGGDKDKVTIMGESAGGSSVINLIASPATDGLFHQAIVQSGVIGGAAKPEVAKRNMHLLLEHLHLTEAEISKMKDTNTEVLQEASLWLLNNYTRENPGIFLPGNVYGGGFLPEPPLEAMKKGRGKGIRLLIGTNKDEATLFIHGDSSNMMYTKEEIEKFFEKCHTPEEVRNKLRKYYNNFETDQDIKNFDRDYTFTNQSVMAADIQSQSADTYMYYFSFEPEPATQMGIGCFHGMEIPLAMGTEDISEMKYLYEASDAEALKKMADCLYQAWTNFIKLGNPNGTGDMPWPKYNTDTRKVYELNTECKVLNNPYMEMMEAFKGLKGYEEIS